MSMVYTVAHSYLDVFIQNLYMKMRFRAPLHNRVQGGIPCPKM